jgi:hypothetical protein
VKQGRSLARVEWKKHGTLVALGALVAGGVGVWYGRQPWPHYGWEIMWTWPVILLACAVVFFVARRRPLPDLDEGHDQRRLAYSCLAVAGIATGLSWGAQAWDAGQCWVSDGPGTRVQWRPLRRQGYLPPPGRDVLHRDGRGSARRR